MVSFTFLSENEFICVQKTPSSSSSTTRSHQPPLLWVNCIKSTTKRTFSCTWLTATKVYTEPKRLGLAYTVVLVLFVSCIAFFGLQVNETSYLLLPQPAKLQKKAVWKSVFLPYIVLYTEYQFTKNSLRQS